MKKKSIQRIITIIVLIFALNIVKTSVLQYKKIYELKEEQLRLENELKKTQQEIRSLNEKKRSSDDLEYVEKVAREELGMVKSDEMIVKDSKEKKSTSEKFSVSPKLTVKDSRN